jgi:hypothetical protein
MNSLSLVNFCVWEMLIEARSGGGTKKHIYRSRKNWRVLAFLPVRAEVLPDEEKMETVPSLLISGETGSMLTDKIGVGATSISWSFRADLSKVQLTSRRTALISCYSLDTGKHRGVVWTMFAGTEEEVWPSRMSPKGNQTARTPARMLMNSQKHRDTTSRQ